MWTVWVRLNSHLCLWTLLQVWWSRCCACPLCPVVDWPPAISAAWPCSWTQNGRCSQPLLHHWAWKQKMWHCSKTPKSTWVLTTRTDAHSLNNKVVTVNKLCPLLFFKCLRCLQAYVYATVLPTLKEILAHFECDADHLRKIHRSRPPFPLFPLTCLYMEKNTLFVQCHTDTLMQSDLKGGRTSSSLNDVACFLSKNTLIPLHDVLQKTDAGCPPVVLYTEDADRNQSLCKEEGCQRSSLKQSGNPSSIVWWFSH